MAVRITLPPNSALVDLDQLDVSRMFQGTTIAAFGTTDVYRLVASNAAIDGDNVVGVRNNATLRWQKETSGDTGTPIPAPNAVPASLGTGKLAPGWIPPDFSNADVYVSPDGDDVTGDGSRQNPVETIYHGISVLRALGGGTLHCADWCEVGGPVPGQGIWLRRDNQVGASTLPGANNNFLPVPGFQEMDVPIQIVFHGSSKQAAFGSTPTGQYHGGGSSQFKPALWIVGSKGANPFRMVNGASDWVQQFNRGYPSDDRTGVLGARLWVEFDRNVDATPVQPSVLSATRTGQSTTFTLDMTTLPSLTVTRARRAAGVTTLIIPNPGIPFPPWKRGQVIRFTSGDSDFASGDYTLTSISDPDQDNTSWEIHYSEAGANVFEKDIAGSSLKSHSCQAKELLWLEVSEGVTDFMTQQYYVTDATADTITVLDKMIAGDASASNIGTITHQERFYVWSSGMSFGNCSMSIQPTRPDATHGWDLGQHLAIPATFKDCWLGGTYLPTAAEYDWRAGAAFYAYAGVKGGVGAYLEGCNGNGGGIYMEAAEAPSVLTAENCLIEQPTILSTKPGVLVNGNDFTSVYIDRFTNADGASGAAWVEINGVPYDGAEVYRSGLVKGRVKGGDSWTNPGTWGAGGNRKNPWFGFDGEGMHITAWADGRITGKHPAAVRLGAPVAARFKNIIDAAEDWIPELGKATRTVGGGELTPSGTPSDLIETTAVANIIIKQDGPDGQTWEEGGKVVFCGWVNSSVSGKLFNQIATIQSGAFATKSFEVGHAATGWQFVSDYIVLGPVSSSTPSYTIYMSLPADASVSLFGLTAFYVPADIDDNDLYEFFGTLKPQPRYLMPGMVGTMEDQKFIAHGGLGVKSDLVVVETPGTADRTLIIYDQAGNPLIKLHGEAP